MAHLPEERPMRWTEMAKSIRDAEYLVTETITDPVLQVSAFEIVLPLLLEFQYEDDR